MWVCRCVGWFVRSDCDSVHVSKDHKVFFAVVS